MFKRHLYRALPISVMALVSGFASASDQPYPTASFGGCQAAPQSHTSLEETEAQGDRAKPSLCHGPDLSPTQSRFSSGYATQPDRSFSTQVVRYRYVCIRWRWDDQQPVGTDDPVLYDDGLTLGANSIAPHERRYRICEEAVSRPFDETGGHISIRYGQDNRLNKPIVLVQGYNFNMQGFYTQSGARRA
ncbi:hypothetical protein [Pseudoalteromonas rubra]|uniref:Uncharacterized protein n=1 Tax=Pseudoalteromonas rubra TaxID=43658 RepID=A0A0F4QJL0_9GAMM|nr:hypothetical protein [Pseudoalteromonas rubra]KJZ07903.1 hypothetical protein TW77_13605 [Pseudoalteromonas rubra]